MRVTIAVTVCVAVLLGAGYATFRHIDRAHAQPVRDLSRMMSVRQVLSGALTLYFQQHARYPRSVSELPLQTLPWGDEGSSARDAEAWTYVSDGSSFTLAWTNRLGSEVYLGGRTGQVYLSRNEKR
jgi:hypothetical protein